MPGPARRVPTGWRLGLPVAVVGVLGALVSLGAAGHSQYDRSHPRIAAAQAEVDEVADCTAQALNALRETVSGYRGMFAEPGPATARQFRSYTRGVLDGRVDQVTYADARRTLTYPRTQAPPAATQDQVAARAITDQSTELRVDGSRVQIYAGVRDRGAAAAVVAQRDVADLMTSVVDPHETTVELLEVGTGSVLWGGDGAEPTPIVVQAAVPGTPELAIRSSLPDATAYPWRVLAAGLLITALACRLLWRCLDSHLMSTADDLQEATDQLRFLTERDPLTALVNREAVVRWLDDWDRRHPDRALGVVYIDLAGFRQINATYGHISGDVVLRELGRRLTVLSEDSDSLVARLAGDHFVVLRATDRGSLQGLAVTVRSLVAEPISVGDRDVHVGSIIGVVERPRDGRNLDTLLGNADHAVRSAAGRSSAIVHFDPDMAAAGTAMQRLARDLRAAVHRPDESFHLVFQPQVDMRTGHLFAAEALLRWQGPNGEQVPPATFIPMASENGLIPALGRWVLREACRTVAMWRVDVPAVVAVNVDARQLHDGFAEQVAATLQQAGARPEWLVIEVTEAAAMEPEAQQQLQRIRELGVGISIDDFGTGYSSLSRLTRLPAGQLKIDRDFITGLTEPGSRNLEIVRTIAALADSLDLQTLAEGVETHEQAEALLAEGIRAGQGYVFCAPVDAPTCLGLWTTGVAVPSTMTVTG